MKGLRDWRVWFGIAITVVCMWLVLRGVSFEDVARDMAKAKLLPLIAIAVPANLYSLYMRALRWRHLTDAIQPIGRGPLVRATCVGFMANNVFPLRIGEVVRAWYLARDVGISGASVLGTVLLERLLDTFFFLAMTLGLVAYYGSRIEAVDPVAIGASLGAVSVLLLGMVLMLRFAPAKIVRAFRFFGGPFLSEILLDRVADLILRFAEGLGSLRGGKHLFWLALHTVYLWLFVQLIPFLAGVWALGIDFGSTSQMLAASYTTLVFVGLAVAVPSAPGFFGPYHAACVLALALFGVPKATAVALGTTIHAIFWLTVTAAGLAVLRARRTTLGELTQASGEDGQDPAPDHR